MSKCKRMFAILLSVMLIATMVPFLGLSKNINAAGQQYTISYKANDASNKSMQEQKTDANGKVVIAKNEFTREGYTFVGWSTTWYGKAVYKGGESITPGKDLTLYAQWKVSDKSKAACWVNKGKIDNTNVDNSTIYLAGYKNYGERLNPRDFIPDSGWLNHRYVLVIQNTDGKFTQKDYAPSAFKSSDLAANGDTYVYNVLTPKDETYKAKNVIVFHPGDSASGVMLPQAVRNGENLNGNLYYRDGYKFSGWATSKTGPVVYKNCATITSDANDIIHLYAKWTKVATVLFNANGGSGTMSKQSIKYNTSTALKANTFKRTYYKFKGWSTSKTGSVKYANKANVKLTSNITLYAQWDRIKYTVAFNANGGKGTMSKQTFSAGVSKALPANKFTKKGYKFKGWATKKGGKVVYKNKQSIKATKSMTLYAVWKK